MWLNVRNGKPCANLELLDDRAKGSKKSVLPHLRPQIWNCWMTEWKEAKNPCFPIRVHKKATIERKKTKKSVFPHPRPQESDDSAKENKKSVFPYPRPQESAAHERF